MSDYEYSPQRFNILPPVCKNLLIINTLMWLLDVVLKTKGINLENALGLHFIFASDFRIWQPITYAFLHANFNHLFFNMFAIWMFGYTLENLWGTKKFIIYCLVACLGAALMQEVTYYFMYKDLLNGTFTSVNLNGEQVISVKVFLNTLNTIGASGICFGLLAAFGLMFPNTYVYFYFLVPIKTKWFVIGYIVLELINGVIGTSDGVAHFAHLGGALFGLILVLYWKKKYTHRY
jgi:membrane associated rhomboid family serine protease